MPGLNETHTPKARLLGVELRKLREQAGFNGRQLATELNITQTTVSRYERGARTAPVDYVARLLGLFGVTGERYEELVEFARTASEPNLIAKPGKHKHLLEISQFDRSADRVVHVSPLMVPGPMQTREYVTAVMAALPEDERDLRVELRMARRDSLLGPRVVQAYVAERALRDDLGGPVVMAAQLRHLIELSNRANIEIRIIPSGLQRWTLAHEGAVVLYEFASAAPIVHLEHYRGPAFLYEPEDVAVYRDAVTKLVEAAVDLEQSVKLMTAILEELEGTAQR